MVPVGRLVILRSVPKSELVSALAYLTIPALIGPIFGPPLGGFITTYFDWRWIFFINIPIGIAGIVLYPSVPRRMTEMIRIILDGVVLGGSVLYIASLTVFPQLLAHTSVPYPQLLDMDEANPEFPRTDVALVVGANDVTNPAARSNPESPLYGMPILDVDKAKNVVVLKRSMNPGFAGIENELYFDPKTAILFGDAKDSIERLIAGVKSV